MRLFERLGQWIDNGLVKIFGKPVEKPIPIVEIVEEPVWKIRKKVTEEARALWREEAIPRWKRKMMDAIDKHREEGWEEEEIIEKYGEGN